MPTHKARNIFSWTTSEVNTVCLDGLYHIPKEMISWKNSTKTAAWKLVPGPLAFGNNEASLLLENEIFEVIYLYRLCNTKVIEISPNEHGWHP